MGSNEEEGVQMKKNGFKWRRRGSNEVWCNYLSDCCINDSKLKTEVIMMGW